MGFLSLFAPLPPLICLAWLLRSNESLRGTTLIAPRRWQIAALILLIPTPWIARLGLSAAQLSFLLFAAATASLCPFMALLGAKRPQDRGWQFVVVSLWGMLLLPAVRHLVLAGDRPLELHPMWRVFVFGLVVVELLNRLPTRYAWRGLSLAAGQSILLLASFQAGQGTPSVEQLPALGSLLCALAWIPAHRGSRRSGWTGVWREFRDHFGAMWGLRVLQRWNATAAENAWPVRLTWSGFEPLEHDRCEQSADSATLRAMENSLHGLLRRFVSLEWIEARRGTADRDRFVDYKAEP